MAAFHMQKRLGGVFITTLPFKNILWSNHISRSLFPKHFTLLAYLSAVDADVVAITETFLDESILNCQFLLTNYVVFRKDRNRHGGGIMILVRSSIPVVRMSELETNCEIVWVKLLTSPSLLFGVFYRPPGPSLSALDELNSSLSLINGGTPLVLCGDFNVPPIDWSVVSPAVSSPTATHLCSITHDCPNSISTIRTVDNLPGTDHDSAEFSICISPTKSSTSEKKLYNYKKADFCAFQELLSHVPWDQLDFE